MSSSEGFSDHMSVGLGHKFSFAHFGLLVVVVDLYMIKVKRVDNDNFD